jgi:hypothetical protein
MYRIFNKKYQNKESIFHLLVFYTFGMFLSQKIPNMKVLNLTKGELIMIEAVQGFKLSSLKTNPRSFDIYRKTSKTNYDNSVPDSFVKSNQIAFKQ